MATCPQDEQAIVYVIEYGCLTSTATFPQLPPDPKLPTRRLSLRPSDSFYACRNPCQPHHDNFSMATPVSLATPDIVSPCGSPNTHFWNIAQKAWRRGGIQALAYPTVKPPIKNTYTPDVDCHRSAGSIIRRRNGAYLSSTCLYSRL